MKLPKILQTPPIMLNRAAAVIVALVVVGLIGVVDYATGDLASMVLLYLGPVAFLAWAIGQDWGIVSAAAAAFASLSSDLLLRAPQVSLATTYWNFVMRLGTLIVVALAVSALRRALVRERETSRTDFLTGLLNSRGFAEVAEVELDRMRRFQRPATLLFLDCDNFKDINDRLGHQAGDQVLKQVSRFLKSSVRRVDTAARLGGDEFVVLLPETDLPAARAAVERIRTSLASGPLAGPNRVGVSIGAATFQQPPSSVDSMVGAADKLLYKAKSMSAEGVAHEVIAEG